MKARWCSGLAATLSLAIGASGSAGASALSDAAAQLQPGQWTTLDTQSFTRALLDDGAGYHVFYYTEDMVWDPVSRQLLFVGGGHGSDAEFLRYRESTNAWTRSKPTGDFWHSSFSHAYDHNAIIPSLGKFFFRQPAYDPSDHVEIYDIASGVWSRSAAMPYRPGCCSGLEYFPELNGLVLADGYSGVMLYNVAANRWSEISGAGWGDYHNFAEYSPVHKVMIFGGGESSGTNALFRLDANRQITRLSNSPAQLGTTHSIVTTDPVSGNFLVFFNSAFYELNPLTDTWRRMSVNPPWQSMGDYGVFGAVGTPISTYGVVAVAKYAGDNSKVYLYRHAASGGSTAPTVSLSASPASVPAQSTSTLTWSATNANACTASDGWTGGKATSGSETRGPFSAASTFTLTCSNTQGVNASRSVTVTVTTATPAPTLALGATPNLLTAGDHTQLSWSTQNAASCNASGAWAGAKATSGSETSAALNASTTFNLDCTGSGGAVARSVSVTVTAPTTPPPEPTPTPTPTPTPPPPGATDITAVTLVSTSTAAQSNVPVTFGQVFKPGDVPAGAVLGARAGSNNVSLQVDKKATHADGSLRHAVLTAVLPSLAGGATQVVTLTNSGTGPGGTAPTAAALLGTTFDTSVNLNIGGTPYTASARALLQSATPATWLSGPLATEWLLSAPLKTAAGAAHPHLQARFYVRAYAGLQAARVEVVVENDWAYETGPRNYSYDARIDVAGRGTVFSQTAVNHYRQSRWRRVVWWGTAPSFTVKHDSAYLMATRAVPTYDTRVQVTSSALNGWVSGLGTNPGVMSIGALEANMPSPGGRFEIAPLPAFQAGYILSQDDRARRVTVGYGEQAGAWPMHYRDKTTGYPISIDTYPNATILGASGIYGNFPACGGTCSTNLVPEASHHPSLAYLPYLITGDYYLMEELAFWGNWMLFYGEAGRRGGSQGLVAWDQVRGQAWALRTLAQAAYATPDSHPLKQYLVGKLQNNISYYRTNWVNSNSLGYVTNTGAAAWLGLDDWIATWMDDFLTWTFGHIVGLGFTEAQPVLAWKSKFPVGRLTDPGMCWVLASSYWPYVKGDRYAGGSSAFVTNWTDWRRNVIFGWNNDAFRGTNDISGREQELFNAQCGSSQMASILGVGTGSMIGWDGAEAYPANLQAAAAVAVEAGVPNAQQAFSVLTSRGAYPLSDYGDAPQWAIFPAAAGTSTPPPSTPAPTLTLTANPTTVTAGTSSTLAWSSTDATSCTASGGWSGSKATSGSQATTALSSSTSYTLTCSGAGGSVQRSATVSVQATPAPTPAPTVSLSANPTSVAAGGSTQLSWSSTNATGCTASGAWSGGKAISGNQTITNLTNTGTFTLQCSGAGGSASRSVTVTVSNGAGAPVIDLNVSPTYMARNKRATLSWTASSAQSCTASGGWSGSRTVQGSEQTPRLTATTTFTLTCTGSGGTSSESATVAVNTPLPKCLSATCPTPTATFSANPTQVASGGSTQLSWSSTNATGCVASGGWSGDKPVSGTQMISNLRSPTTFSITCSGAGGRARSSLTVNIGSSAPPTPPAPTVALTANPTSISSGGSTQLTWSSTDATSCAASGGWSGAKAISGTQTLSAIQSSSTFTLTCTGAGGSASRDASVNVTSPGNAGLFGGVDSSFVDRFGDNRIYVFNGNVTPDDIDGDAVEPITTLPVVQDANACTFGFAGLGLAAGTYTIAFTQDAAADLAGQSDNLVFVGARQVTLSGSGTTANFRPANLLQVGPGRPYATLRAANLVATDGAVVEIDAGTYTDDVTVWRQNRVTLRGVGGRAHIKGNRVIPYVSGEDRNNGMGLMVIRGTGISVENLEFSAARVADLNGAGIRNQGRDLSICNGYFHDNEDGFLGGAYGTLLFEYSEFANNGSGDPGHNHNVYVDEGSAAGDRLIFRYNYSHHTLIGHTLKTRARENYVLYNRLMDEQTGTSSYGLDVPNGGLTFVIGNLLQQGPYTDNSAIVNYGTEGLSSGRTHQLYLVNNTFVNDLGSGQFVQIQSGTSLVRTINNLFVGGGSVPSGTVVQATTNLTTNAPGFVNEGAYDYRLTVISPARDGGTAPGSAAGVSLAPAYQYVHKAQRETRPADARIDIGAYEYQ